MYTKFDRKSNSGNRGQNTAGRLSFRAPSAFSAGKSPGLENSLRFKIRRNISGLFLGNPFYGFFILRHGFSLWFGVDKRMKINCL